MGVPPKIGKVHICGGKLTWMGLYMYMYTLVGANSYLLRVFTARRRETKMKLAELLPLQMYSFTKKQKSLHYQQSVVSRTVCQCDHIPYFP